MTTFFTSDLHLGHARVIDYCKRPFRSVWEMDAELIRRWNARVAPNDTVFVLGDFALGPKERLREYVQQLHGALVLIRGNHDRNAVHYKDAGFTYVHNSLLYMPNNAFDVWMSHRPHLELNALMAEGQGPSIRTKYHLCGHVHERWRRIGNTINVGVDVWGFQPVTLDELLEAKDDGRAAEGRGEDDA